MTSGSNPGPDSRPRSTPLADDPASPAPSPGGGRAPVGAVLAGGESSRYGSPKALAEIGGRRIVDRVIAALRGVTPDIIISANEPELFEDLELPTFPDDREGLGPLGGIHTVLRRAREAGRPGVLAVACDLPFPSVELLSLLRRIAFGDATTPSPSTTPTPSTSTNTTPSTKTPRPDIVLPASPGPRGVEPLFAAYRTTCIPAIDAALADGDRRMIGFHERVSVHTIPLAEVQALVDPGRAFLNVNTPADRERAEAMAKRGGGARQMVVDWSGREADWLTVREAVERGLAAVERLESERVALEEALGRVLADDVVSPVHQPPWDNSAMDGYAGRAADVRGASPDDPVRLTVVDDIPAGGFPSRPIGPGEAAKIMTGAPVPEGADSVVRVEHTDAGDDVVTVSDDHDAGSNIRRKGEDLREGETALESGYAIGPAAMGVLAIVGVARPLVVRRPVVAILSNGDELVDLDDFDQVRAGRKIVNSNSYSLLGAVAAMGCVPKLLGIAKDDPADIRAKLEAGLDADVLVTSAGAAVGEHDRVKDVLDELGYELDFWRVRMRPGSPASLGRIPRPDRPLLVWGLPGNPVSALATFMVLVAPPLRRMLGRRHVHNAVFPVEAEERIPSKPDKTHFQRVILQPGDPVPLARPTGAQGSGILTSMTRADGLFVVPEGLTGVEPGGRGVAMALGAPDRAVAEYALPA